MRHLGVAASVRFCYMPLEFQVPNPVTILPFGPGADFILNDSTVGPFPIDDRVTIDLYSTDGETSLGQVGFVDVQTNRWTGTWLYPDFTSAAWNFIRDAVEVPLNAELNLVARRTHANGTLVSQDSVKVKWAPTQFVWHLQWWDLFTRQRGSAGFTPTDRDLLTHIDSGIWRNFPGG